MSQEKRPFYLVFAILLLLGGIRLIEIGLVIGGSLFLFAAAVIFTRSYKFSSK